MTEFDARWHGEGWQALVSREPYGFHLSVSAQGRKPTDQECAAAVFNAPEQFSGDFEETPGPGLNPYVRHFIAP